MNPPNIILILTDHFRPDALGRSTPNLARLAADGVRFDNAYCASPLCQPARASIITGLCPAQHGICGNQSDPIPSELRADTFMQHLRQVGYFTALIGKHHYLDRYGIGMDVRGDDETVKGYGFDHVFQVVDDGENCHNDDEYTTYLRTQGKLEAFRKACRTSAWACGPHPFEEDESADGFIGSHGVRFIEESTGTRPFYLNLSFIGPHPPYWHPGELAHDPKAMQPPLGAPDTETTRLRRAHYLDKCALIDRYVGSLVAALKSRELLDNTVIVFTSDHGDNLGDYGIWDKRFFYENSVGVPLFLHGPRVPRQERMNGPRVSKALVTHLDLYPTILGLAGIDVPLDRRRVGRDLIAMLNGTPGTAHDAVYAELGTCVMIRTGNWKLVFDPEQGGVQGLYNLAVDPAEARNLAGTPGYEPVILDLLQRLLGHRIHRTQTTHAKEEQRLQRVHLGR